MAQQFQVGDIVRVNEPTPEDFEAMSSADLAYDCEHLVGKLAIVYIVDTAETTLVGLVPCEEDYKFKFQDIGKLSFQWGVYTVPSQLSLVRESELRTLVMTETSELPLVNQPIPLIGTHMTHRIELPSNRTIEKGAVVGKIHKETNGIMIVFYNPSGSDRHIIVSTRELRPPFTTF